MTIAALDASQQLIQQIDRNLAKHDQTFFIRTTHGWLTYGDCRERMIAWAAEFARLNIGVGQRALISSHDDELVCILFLTLLRVGITPVIADPKGTREELQRIAIDFEVAVIISDVPTNLPIGQTVELLSSEAPDLLVAGSSYAFPSSQIASDCALLILTSGTTSKPKAVELSHANLTEQLQIFEAAYDFDDSIRLFNSLPLHHVDGLIRGPLAAMWFGGSLDRSLAFTIQSIPAILDSMGSGAITHFIAVPAILRLLLRFGGENERAFKTDAFRFVISSADLLDETLWRQFEAKFGVTIINAYGLSEVVCDALFSSLHGQEGRVGTLGRPKGCTATVIGDDGSALAVGHVGELVLEGPTVMQGYFKDPARTAEVIRDGRLHTGDLVMCCTDGSFQFVGRKKTAIVSGGHTIQPETATQVLCGMPGIFEALAFGVADVLMGEKLVAAVVPEKPDTMRTSDVVSYMHARISTAIAPKEYVMLAKLPRNAAGKVDLNALKQEFIALQHKGADKPASSSVAAIAAKCFGINEDALNDSSTPFNTQSWDSMAHMLLIEELEGAFGIQFSAMQIVEINSLGDIKGMVDELLALQ